jgi:hypothetical protein
MTDMGMMGDHHNQGMVQGMSQGMGMMNIDALKTAKDFDKEFRAIQTVDANATVQGDPQTKIVLVETKSPEPEIKVALAEAGYPAS